MHVPRRPYARALRAETTQEFDFVSLYVEELTGVIDMEAIRSAGVRIGDHVLDLAAVLDATVPDGPIILVGHSMGGFLALHLAALRPDKVAAAVPFYGFPQGEQEPDWSTMTAAVRGHMAQHDDFFGPEAARELEQKLQQMAHDTNGQ